MKRQVLAYLFRVVELRNYIIRRLNWFLLLILSRDCRNYDGMELYKSSVKSQKGAINI